MDIEIGYYDKVLAGISGSLAAGAGAGLLLSIPLKVGLGAGSLVAMAIMYQGMFRKGPEG